MFLSFSQYKLTFILALACLSLSGYTFAQPAATSDDFLSADKKGGASADKLFTDKSKDPKAKQGWSGQAQVGLVSSTGNADNNSTTAGVTAVYNKRRLKHTLTGDIYFAENKGERTAERFALGHKLDYAINSKSYVFNFLTYDQDKFANIDSRIADVIGYGRKLIESEKHSLIGEIGLGARQTEHIDETPDSNEAVGHFGLHYKGQLTDTTTLTEDLTIQSGKDNTFSESVTALQVAMTEKLSLSLNYSVRNNTEVPTGFEKTDTVTSINLVGKF